MKNRLPLYLENLELPVDEVRKNNRNNSYGYVNFIYIISLIITGFSIVTILILGR